MYWRLGKRDLPDNFCINQYDQINSGYEKKIKGTFLDLLKIPSIFADLNKCDLYRVK